MSEGVLLKCSKCGENKPSSAFHRNKAQKRGYEYYCKKCREKHNKNYYVPKFNRVHREEISKWHQQSYIKNRDKILLAQKKYRENNPKKRHAGNVAKNKPLETQCELCGSTENLLRHHPDYDEPSIFVTLCHPCHYNIHYETNI